MNDGSSAPALDDLPLLSSSASTASSENRPDNRQESASASRPDINPPVETPEARLAFKRHLKLLELLNAYDSLVYMELAALYYLDTSTILIILRTLVHLTQISHARTLALARASRINLKPAKANIFLVLSINLLAILVHAFMVPAEASELTRGYLHGHLIVDLIGQKGVVGWLGKARLCLMDCLVGLLQVIAVGIVGEADRAEGTLEKSKHGGVQTQDSNGATEEDTQQDRSTPSSGDHGISFSAFRRGRRQTLDLDRNAAIELQDLNPTLTGPSLGGLDLLRDDPERRRLRSESDGNLRSEYESEDRESPSQMMDDISSGQAYLMHLRVADLLRAQFWEWRNRRLVGRV